MTTVVFEWYCITSVLIQGETDKLEREIDLINEDKQHSSVERREEVLETLDHYDNSCIYLLYYHYNFNKKAFKEYYWKEENYSLGNYYSPRYFLYMSTIFF